MRVNDETRSPPKPMAETSLCALSTELDENILQRLAQSELSLISRTSKYYWALAEPVLYKSVTFSKHQNYELVCFFLTILKRNDLAKHIRFFCCSVGEAKELRPISKHLYEELRDNIAAIRPIIQKMAAPLRDPKLTMYWYGCNYLLPSSTDGALATILCMASNLEHIALVPSTGGPIVRNLIRRRWLDVINSATTFPFCKLKMLDTRYAKVTILPIMEKLRLTNVGHTSFPRCLYIPYVGMGLATNLQVLEFSEGNFDTTKLEWLIASQKLRNLKQLKCSGIGDGTSHSPWESYDFSRLSRALVAHVPKLHVFEWSKHKFNSIFHPSQEFGALTGLKHLTDLTLDIGLLSRTRVIGQVLQHPTWSDKPNAYLPSGLRVFCITSIPPFILEMILMELNEPTILDLILAVASRSKLHAIELSLIMETQHGEFGCRATELTSSLHNIILKTIETLASKERLYAFCANKADLAASSSTNRISRLRYLTGVTWIRVNGLEKLVDLTVDYEMITSRSVDHIHERPAHLLHHKSSCQTV